MLSSILNVSMNISLDLSPMPIGNMLLGLSLFTIYLQSILVFFFTNLKESCPVYKLAHVPE